MIHLILLIFFITNTFITKFFTQNTPDITKAAIPGFHLQNPEFTALFIQCGMRDLNPHAFRHKNLNLACLPIPSIPQVLCQLLIPFVKAHEIVASIKMDYLHYTFPVAACQDFSLASILAFSYTPIPSLVHIHPLT